MSTAPSKPLWFFRKKTILIFAIAQLIFLGLGGYRAYELYQKGTEFHFVVWKKIYEPLYIIGGIPVMIYLCIVGMWLILFFKKQIREMLGMDDWKSRQ